MKTIKLKRLEKFLNACNNVCCYHYASDLKCLHWRLPDKGGRTIKIKKGEKFPEWCPLPDTEGLQ